MHHRRLLQYSLWGVKNIKDTDFDIKSSCLNIYMKHLQFALNNKFSVVLVLY